MRPHLTRRRRSAPIAVPQLAAVPAPGASSFKPAQAPPPAAPPWFGGGGGHAGLPSGGGALRT